VARLVLAPFGQGVESLARECVPLLVRTDALGLPFRRLVKRRLPRLPGAPSSPQGSDSLRVEGVPVPQDTVSQAKVRALQRAMSRSLRQWLEEQRLLWPSYAKRRASVAQDPRRPASRRAAVGKRREAVTQRWGSRPKGPRSLA
jgi:hypothetical protein